MEKITEESFAGLIKAVDDTAKQYGMKFSVSVDLFVLDLLVKELAERREAAKKPFMYGIIDPDGKPHFDEFCVSGDIGHISAVVDELNEMQCEHRGDFRVVKLYAEPLLPTDLDDKE